MIETNEEKHETNEEKHETNEEKHDETNEETETSVCPKVCTWQCQYNVMYWFEQLTIAR